MLSIARTAPISANKKSIAIEKWILEGTIYSVKIFGDTFQFRKSFEEILNMFVDIFVHKLCSQSVNRLLKDFTLLIEHNFRTKSKQIMNIFEN